MAEEQQYVFCTNCGTKNSRAAKFCINCGQPLVKPGEADHHEQQATAHRRDVKQSSVMDATTSRINSWTGGRGAVKVSLRDFFGQVFHHHTEREAEDIFIVGTEHTTPSLTDLADDRVQPWLFSRALLFTLVLAALLWVLSILNPRTGVTVSLDVAIAIAVPVSALILFFEVNVYRNISFYQVIQIFLMGGALSLIATIILDSLLGNNGELNLWGALTTGIAEELAKVLVAAYFISRLNVKHIFNGMLIGAAVGSGFAAFENVMYMVDDNTGQLASVSDALLRALFSISDHTEWCAIAAAALVMVKGSRRLSFDDFMQPAFLRFLISVILIHALWDWDAISSLLTMAVLAVITWIFVFVLIHAGLREVKEMQLQLKQQQSTAKEQ